MSSATQSAISPERSANTLLAAMAVRSVPFALASPQGERPARTVEQFAAPDPRFARRRGDGEEVGRGAIPAKRTSLPPGLWPVDLARKWEVNRASGNASDNAERQQCVT